MLTKSDLSEIQKVVKRSTKESIREEIEAEIEVLKDELQADIKMAQIRIQHDIHELKDRIKNLEMEAYLGLKVFFKKFHSILHCGSEIFASEIVAAGGINI